MLSALHRLIPSSPRRCFLLDLPPEILEYMIEWLPLDDRACLALTCKFLFFRYCSVHVDPLLRQRRPLANKTPILCPNAEKQLPVAFLRRLENARWVLCLECWKLHLRERMKKREHHCYECDLLRGGTCVLDAGVIDLCPCLGLTIRDMVRLIESLKVLRDGSELASAERAQDAYYQDVLVPSTSCGTWTKLVHRCQVIEHPYVKAGITTNICLSRKNEVFIQNTYLFNSFRSTAVASESSHASMCPYEQTTKWLRRFFKDAGSDFTGYPQGFRRYASCWIKSVVRHGQGEGLEIVVERHLGFLGHKKQWKRNRRRQMSTFPWYKRLRFVRIAYPSDLLSLRGGD